MLSGAYEIFDNVLPRKKTLQPHHGTDNLYLCCQRFFSRNAYVGRYLDLKTQKYIGGQKSYINTPEAPARSRGFSHHMQIRNAPFDSNHTYVRTYVIFMTKMPIYSCFRARTKSGATTYPAKISYYVTSTGTNLRTYSNLFSFGF